EVAKPMLGAALMGVLGIGYLLIARTQGLDASIPNFFGNGYPTIDALLEPSTFNPAQADADGRVANPLQTGEVVSTTLLMLVLLLVCKGVATALTLGSGGSG